MAFELQLVENADLGIRRIIVELIDETVHQLTTTPDGPHRAVHNTRKSCKRIRAALRLVRDALGEEAYHLENAYYRDVSRQLADVRDSLVIVYALEAVAKHFEAEITPGAFDHIRQRLFARHQTVSQQILADGEVLLKVAEALQVGRERVLAWPLAGQGFGLFAPGLARVYRRGRRRMAKAYASGDAALFHDWRKRVKYLWHQMEILRPIWPTRLDSLVVDLKQVSDYLGDAHDLVALGQMLIEQPALVENDPALPLLLTLIERWQDDFEAAASPLGARLFFETPAQFVATIEQYWQLWRGGEAIIPGPSLAAIRVEYATTADDDAATGSVGEPAGDLLTTGQAAERLGLTPGRVRRLIRRGQLPAVKIGSFWVIHETDLPDPEVGLSVSG
jgi:excisionase family DNA binding protein